MTTLTRRLTATFLAAGLLLAGACSDDDGDDAADTTTTEAAAEGTDGSEGGSAGSIEPAEGEEPGTEADDTTTTAPDTGDEPDEGQGAADEEAADVDWSLNAVGYRGQDGRRVAFLCPPDAPESPGPVWGTEVYTDDSAVCWAAVHAGLINTIEGGRVIIEIAPAEEEYEGSTANGVESQDYGAWGGSFTFPES